MSEKRGQRMGRMPLYGDAQPIRAMRKVRFGRRMKPRSWPTAFWFGSALFDRGILSRKRAFAAIMVNARKALWPSW